MPSQLMSAEELRPAALRKHQLLTSLGHFTRGETEAWVGHRWGSLGSSHQGCPQARQGAPQVLRGPGLDLDPS